MASNHGVPRGRVVKSRCGKFRKTTLASHHSAIAKLGGVCAFIDAEHT